ncbi:hypothetical protein OIO90_004793 [Microbotryomycetes sp. JL221]|nr:hypothetical protein OIO90_004793 [Microbotryomycetes sp. JL221]
MSIPMDLVTYHPNALVRSTVVAKLAQGPTLLPHTIASLVSALSIASRISLRSAAMLIEGLIESIRLGTLTGLGVTRRALIAAVSSARTMHYVARGLDWTGKIENANTAAEMKADERKFMNVLDHYTNVGVYVITHVFTLAELFTLAGLSLTSTAVSFGFQAAEESVRILDSVLGSNETSRALAAIIALVRSELRDDPSFASVSSQGTVTTLTTLTRTLTAFVCLQAATNKRTAREMRMRVIYDCTVLDEGQGHVDSFGVQGDRGEDTVLSDTGNSNFGTESAATTSLGRRSRAASVALQMTQVTAGDDETVTDSVESQAVEDETRIYQTLIDLCGGEDEVADSDPNAGERDGLLPLEVQEAFEKLQERTSTRTLASSRNASSYEIEISETTTTTTTLVRAIEETMPIHQSTRSIEAEDDGRRPSMEADDPWQPIDDQDLQEFEPATAVFLQPPSATDQNVELQSSDDTKPRIQVVFQTMTQKFTSKTRTTHTVSSAIREPGSQHDEELDTAMSNPKAATTNRPGHPVDWQWPVGPARETSPERSPSSSRRMLRTLGNAVRKVTGTPVSDNLFSRKRRSANSSRRTTPASTPGFVSPARSPILGAAPSNHSRRHSRQHSVSSFCLDNGGQSSAVPSNGVESEDPSRDIGTPTHLRRASSIHSMRSTFTTCKHTASSPTEEPEPKVSNFPRRHLVDNLQRFMRYSSAAYGQAFLRIMGLGRSRGLDFTFPNTRAREFPSHDPRGFNGTDFEQISAANRHAFSHHVGVHVDDILLDTYSDSSAGVFDNDKISPISAAEWHRRPIKCYSYGTPSVASLDLQRYCRGLVISTIHNNDVVPTLSLGLLRDLKTSALILHEDRHRDTTQDIIGHVIGLWQSKAARDRQSVLSSCSSPALTRTAPSLPLPPLASNTFKAARNGINSLYETPESARQVALSHAELVAGRGSNKAAVAGYRDPALMESEMADEIVVNDYLWSVMRTLRASNDNDKLYPPGDAYIVENYTVFVSSESNKTQYSRREGKRILLRAVDDPVKRFSEPVFGKSLFTDHSPSEYESNLDLLSKAVLG